MSLLLGLDFDPVQLVTVLSSVSDVGVLCPAVCLQHSCCLTVQEDNSAPAVPAVVLPV